MRKSSPAVQNIKENYLEVRHYDGMAGRYRKVEGEFNSRGEPLNIWDVAKDNDVDPEGKIHLTESVWPYVANIQRNFAARVAWAAADSYEKGEHAPTLTISGGTDLTVVPGQTVCLHAEAGSPDGAAV